MSAKKQGPIRRFLFENSIFLIVGAIAALVWANLDLEAYKHFCGIHDPHPKEEGDLGLFPLRWHALTLKFVIDDIGMAFFFAIAGKEVWEALLPGGPLSNFRRAAMPLMATAGGMVGPAGLYLLGCYLTGSWDDLNRGWAVPMATDIAFSYLVARFIFGPQHVAIPFLLLLAIADDAGGLIVLAAFYPQKAIHPEWFLVTAAGIALGFALRKFKVHNHWAYLLGPGTLCWFSFFQSGVHPALGLVPMIPCLPHAHTDLGLFVKKQLGRDDTLNAFEHWWKNPVELILGLFGFVNAGVLLSAMGTGTYLVLFGLLVGKPLGISLFAWVGAKVFKLELPSGMNNKHLLVVGFVAAIGFTVSLFVASAAFTEPGPTLDSVKMGALLSFVAIPLSIIVARMIGVRPGAPPESESTES